MVNEYTSGEITKIWIWYALSLKIAPKEKNSCNGEVLAAYSVPIELYPFE